MKLSGGGWVLCWWGRTDPSYDAWFQQCYYFPPDDPGFLTFPWCPSNTYEAEYICDSLVVEGDECGCCEVKDAVFRWEPTGGPWGQWVGQVGDCGGEPVMVYVRPNGVSGGGGAGWDYEIVWGAFTLTDSTFWACSQFPFQYAIDHWTDGPCPGSRVVLTWAEPS